MNYIGGKQKSGGAQISRTINSLIKRRALTSVTEPFCGGLSVTSRLVAKRRWASDACVSLITLYTSMQSGWRPPSIITREEWEALRASQNPKDPMTAFAGFGCSRSGNWFSSFAETTKRTGQNYVPAALAARESLMNKLNKCTGVEFHACDYRESPMSDVVYCDPPYEGTMPYKAVLEPFDSTNFWAWAREMSRSTFIAVSEQKAPADFVPLLSFSLQNRLVNSAPRRVEHLFVPESQVSIWREVA